MKRFHGEAMNEMRPFHGLSEVLNGVALTALPFLVGTNLVKAVKDKLGGAVRLDVPESSIAAAATGDAIDEPGTTLTFPVTGGEGRLAFSDRLSLTDTEAELLSGQLRQLWNALEGHTEKEAELSRVRFHLQGLEQMAATIAVVRDVPETERLALDSAREIFFAWWAALYRLSDGRYRSSTTVSVQATIEPHDIEAEVIDGIIEGREGPIILDSPRAFSEALPEAPPVIVPLEIAEHERVVIALGSRMTDQPFGTEDSGLLRALAYNTTVALRNAELVRDLKREATVDPLTTCLNRRGFDSRLAAEMNRSSRYERSLTLILLDIDRFKDLNDTYGHPVGDEVLRRLGAVLKRRVRDTDVVARFGGEEFAVVLPETEKSHGAILAERLREAVEAMETPPQVPGPITASFGVADFPSNSEDEATLIEAADKALYKAKQSGRNRIAVR